MKSISLSFSTVLLTFVAGQLSMKNKKLQCLTLFLLAFAGAQVANAAPSGGAYVADEQRFYIEGQPLTDSVEVAETIVCYLAAMRPDAFIDGGAYIAKFYDDRCEAGGADSTSETASATPTSASSEASAGAATAGAANTAEEASLATLNVVFDAIDGVARGKGWISEDAEDEDDFADTIYISMELTEGVSKASPNGDYEVWYSVHISEDFPQFGLSAGDVMSSGYLKVSGKGIILKEISFDGDSSLALSISDNGDTEGIFNRTIGVCQGCPVGGGPPSSDSPPPKFPGVQGNYQFNIDVAEKQFCQNLQSIFAVCNYRGDDLDVCTGAEDTRPDKDDEEFNGFEPLRVPLSFTQLEDFLSLDGNTADIAVDSFGELVSEECFSTDKSLATKNVYRYGVYGANGDRTTLAKEGEVDSFSMFADVVTEVEVDGVVEEREERIYGNAEYHGIYFDPRGRQIMEPGVTEFRKDDFGNSVGSSSSDTYIVAETEVLVEKRTGEYTALIDLNKIQIGLYVRDDRWADEFTALLGVSPVASGYEQFSGSYNALADEFTLSTGVSWFPNYKETPLSTPIVFTPKRWLDIMKKVEDSWTETLGMGVWSNDTRQWYEISVAALADPELSVPFSSDPNENCPADRWSTVETDSCRGGVKTEKTEYLPVSALAGSKLACIENCLEPSLMQATYLAGYCTTEDGKADVATCGGLASATYLPTPFARVGPFLKDNVTFRGHPFSAGTYWDGIRASNVVKYDVTTDNTGFEVGGVALTKGNQVSSYLNASSDPYNAFGEEQFATFDNPSRYENLSWGLGTGRLILESDLSEIECEKDGDGDYEVHPLFTGAEVTELRYCMDKIHSGVGLTTYQIRINNHPSYSLTLSGTETAVVIATPRTLFYQVPDEAGYGQDRGKRLSLEFAGHGELRGVPGYVYDVDTGEDLGEFITEWKETYRYINRFVIPDGSVVTDSDGVEYFVKALDGEEWFNKLNPLEGSGSQATYTSTPDQLAPNSILRVMGDPNDAQHYIGEPPTCVDPDNAATCKLLNKGSPIVEQGVLASGFEMTTQE